MAQYFELSEVAKVLNYKDMGRNNLFKFLRDIRLLNRENQPYQRYIEQGVFIVEGVPWDHPTTGEPRLYLKTVVTRAGIEYIRSKLDENGFTPRKQRTYKRT